MGGEVIDIYLSMIMNDIHLTFYCILLKLTYFKKHSRSIFTKLILAIRSITRSFPISRYCKLDTGIQQPKLHPELQMQQKLQVDLLLRLVNFTSLVPTWHGAPSQVDHTLNYSSLTAPLQQFIKQWPM